MIGLDIVLLGQDIEAVVDIRPRCGREPILDAGLAAGDAPREKPWECEVGIDVVAWILLIGERDDTVDHIFRLSELAGMPTAGQLPMTACEDNAWQS